MALDTKGEAPRSSYRDILEEERAREDRVIDVLSAYQRIMNIGKVVVVVVVVVERERERHSCEGEFHFCRFHFMINV